ncbi:MAG TPA: 5-formyltetrahydrofolate cyclo-ligase [Allocoleopsis sp.]
MSELTALTKGELRRSLLTTRTTMPLEIWQAKSQQICQHLQHFPLFTQSRTILTYISVRQEPDLKALLPLRPQWGLSRCVGKALSWHVWLPDSSRALPPNKYGIPEPEAGSPLLSSDQVDLLLLPAVACDRQGYRLGYGGGFYDRLLSTPEWASIPTIGITFDFAYLPQLPVDSWDLPLQAVCTERGVFPASQLPV